MVQVGLATRLVEKRDIPGDAIRAIAQINRSSGFHILMGCSADADSYESSQYGQGLLTYALLEGMQTTKGLRKDSEGFREDVQALFQYAKDRVPQLAESIGGIQEPRIAAPQGDTFAIGLLKTW